MRINISLWNPPKGPQGKIRCNLPNPNIKTASLSLGFGFRKQKNDIIVTTILWPIFLQPKLVNHRFTMTRALNGATLAKSSELRKQKCGWRIIFLERVCKKEGRPGKGITVYDGLAANDLKTRQLQQRSYDRPPSFSPSEDVNCLLSWLLFLFSSPFPEILWIQDCRGRANLGRQSFLLSTQYIRKRSPSLSLSVYSRNCEVWQIPRSQPARATLSTPECLPRTVSHSIVSYSSQFWNTKLSK